MTGCTVSVLGQKALVSAEDVLVCLECLLVVLVDLGSCSVSLLSELTNAIDFIAHQSLAHLRLAVGLVDDIVVS